MPKKSPGARQRRKTGSASVKHMKSTLKKSGKRGTDANTTGMTIITVHPLNRALRAIIKDRGMILPALISRAAPTRLSSSAGIISSAKSFIRTARAAVQNPSAG